MAENAILRQSTLTIMQQINELKNWHKQRLKLDSQTKLADKGSPFETKNLQVSNKNVTGLLQSGKYEHHNPDSQLSFDDKPIKTYNHNIKEIIENNMMENETLIGKNEQNEKKPKFSFLKKGEGIARFRMGPQKTPNSIKKCKRTLDLSSGMMKSNKHVEYISENLTTKENEIPTLDPPDLKLSIKNWKRVFNNGQVEQLVEEVVNNNKLWPNSNIDSSSGNSSITGRKQLKEREELRVFETMEQHVLDSSFCSTSSYVRNMMENAVISTPVKMSLSNRNSLTSCNQRNQLTTVLKAEKNQEYVDPKCLEMSRPEPPMWIKPENTESTGFILNDKEDKTENEIYRKQGLHVRFDVSYKSLENSETFEDSTVKEINSLNQEESSGEKVFEDSGEWKDYSEGDSSSSCHCSTKYSSSDEDDRAISPPVRPPVVVRNNRVQSGEQNEEKGDGGVQNKNSTQDMQHMFDSNGDIDVLPPILASKLKELKEEIDTFRAENNKLKALSEKLEKKFRQFQEAEKKFIKEMEEEKKKNAKYLEEEKQKLAKQKFTFEKYSKSLTKNPTREERKEIQALREQLSEMKEELNKKESRWGAAQASVRNQVKYLEEDNKKLRDELEVLRKQSRHLEFLTRKKNGKRLNNTQRIHAINEMVSNIPIEDDNEALNVLAGNRGPLSNSVKTLPVDEVDPRSINTKVIRENVPKIIPKRNESNKKLKDSSNKQVVVEPIKENNISPTTDIDCMPKNDQNKINIEKDDFFYGKPSEEKSPKVFVEDPPHSCTRETINEDCYVEKIHPDGKIERRYKNGNIKKIDPNIGLERIIYFNGDVEEILRDGTVKYYFDESRIWHMKLPDGSEISEFPNGQVEKRLANGTLEITYPNNNKKIEHPDGSVEIYYADGVIEKIAPNKDKVILFLNGQKEFTTAECIRREYPDGSCKKVFPDGATETVYSNGRVRLKDKHGNLVMDSWHS